MCEHLFVKLLKNNAVYAKLIQTNVCGGSHEYRNTGKYDSAEEA